MHFLSLLDILVNVDYSSSTLHKRGSMNCSNFQPIEVMRGVAEFYGVTF